MDFPINQAQGHKQNSRAGSHRNPLLGEACLEGLGGGGASLELLLGGAEEGGSMESSGSICWWYHFRLILTI